MIVFLWKDGYNVRSSAVNHFNCTFDIFLCVCVNKYIAFTQVLCAQKITIVPPALPSWIGSFSGLFASCQRCRTGTIELFIIIFRHISLRGVSKCFQKQQPSAFFKSPNKQKCAVTAPKHILVISPKNHISSFEWLLVHIVACYLFNRPEINCVVERKTSITIVHELHTSEKWTYSESPV